MTKLDKQRFTTYVREIMDLLHLKDWDETTLFRTPSRQGDDLDVPNAQAHVGRHRKIVEFQFDPEWLHNAPREEQRHTVVHESLHCHGGPLWNFLRITLLDGADLTQVAYDTVMSGAEQNIEYMIDGIADAVAPLLPLPPAFTGK